jgi:hypothetical protein
MIPNIIYLWLRERRGSTRKYFPDKKAVVVELLRERLDELDLEHHNTPKDNVVILALYAQELGYIVQDLMGQLGGVDDNLQKCSKVGEIIKDEEMGATSGTRNDESEDIEVVQSNDETVLLKLRKYTFSRVPSAQPESSSGSQSMLRERGRAANSRCRFEIWKALIRQVNPRTASRYMVVVRCPDTFPVSAIPP